MRLAASASSSLLRWIPIDLILEFLSNYLADKFDPTAKTTKAKAIIKAARVLHLVLGRILDKADSV